ncbi:LysR family transcriptional regulator [Pseudonocardia xinjiangensis]|uniref:LysR family transcriptional regulator n=1 Tax=Pseudonocardia xinjiangensis TaxID=75289 RepID=A0ABX1R5J1_9PSEU|nr:LysR family transcriptional regulator [Pseudonocardia xinjiangensis]
MPVELRHLEHFVALAEESSFTRAAARLNLVQSALSVSIRNLEKDLEATLFDRTSRGVRLAAAGEALLPAARRVLREVATVREEVDAVRGVVRGRLRIGIMQSLALIDAGRMFAAFHQAHPGVVIEPQPAHGGSVALAEHVRHGELDLAFAWQPEASARGLRVAELATEPFVLVVPTSRRLPRRLELADLSDEAFVEFPEGWGARTLSDQAFRNAGIQRRIVVEVADILTCAELVRAGFGVAIMPKSMIRSRGLTWRTVSGLPQWGVSLIASSDRHLTAAAAAFVDLVCTTFDVVLATDDE